MAVQTTVAQLSTVGRLLALLTILVGLLVALGLVPVNEVSVGGLLIMLGIAVLLT